MALVIPGQLLAEPVRLSNGPAASWELVERDGDHHCLLRTRISPGTPLNTVDLSRDIGGRELELRLHGPKTGKPSVEISAGYLVGKGAIKSQEVVEHDDDQSRRKIVLEFQGAEAADIANGSAVSFAVARGEVITLDTSGVGKFLPALEDCDRKAFVELGADPQMVAQVAVEPRADDAKLFSPVDYPLGALRMKEQGTVIVLATVNKVGKVRDCRVVRSSKSIFLDQATCDTLKGREFDPALDANGNPVDAPASLRVNWVLP